MRLFSSITSAILLVLLLPGCGVLKFSKKKPAPEKPLPQGGAMALIGIVELVNPEQKYVLIRCEVAPALPPGTELIALDASGAQSKLVLTPERKGLYLTADVKQGSPQVSNLVMQRLSGPAQPAAPAPGPPPGALPSVPLTNPFPEPPPTPGSTLPLEPSLPLPTETKPAPPP